jgi:hypothetical protein
MTECPLREITIVPNEATKTAVARVVIADHRELDQAKEWLRAQVSIELMQRRNFVMLRLDALRKVQTLLVQEIRRVEDLRDETER